MSRVTYVDALEHLSYDTWLQLLLSKDEIALTKKDVDKFMSYKHRVGPGVLNAVLIKAITTAKRNHGPKRTINEAYLRITFESFVLDETKTKIIISTTEQAINKLTNESDDLKKAGMIKPVKPKIDDSFALQYLEELKEKERQQELQDEIEHQEYLKLKESSI